MSVLEVIQRSADFLTRKGVESARLQVELLVAQVLRLPRLHLYLNFERALSGAELEQVRSLVQRRGAREPLQYILGSTNFCGLEMEVNRHVLIPRPETELLAEFGWKFLRGLAAADERLWALDFGTGGGCLAVAVAFHSGAQVVGLDVSAEALKTASKNAERHGSSKTVHWVQANGLSCLQPARQFHLLITNPPYIPSAEIETLPPEIREFEPRGALDGGLDGLDYFELLANKAGLLLHSEGKLMAEFGDGQEEKLRELFSEKDWIIEKFEPDYTQRSRFLIASPGS
jgi:release factor glutamine methyltransferase